MDPVQSTSQNLNLRRIARHHDRTAGEISKPELCSSARSAHPYRLSSQHIFPEACAEIVAHHHLLGTVYSSTVYARRKDSHTCIVINCLLSAALLPSEMLATEGGICARQVQRYTLTI